MSESKPCEIHSEAYKLVRSVLSQNGWKCEDTFDKDSGTTCILDLTIGQYKIYGCAKGTTSCMSDKLKKESYFPLKISTKTINYALNKAQSFVVFYVFTKEKKIYYLPIQEYFLENQKYNKKSSQDTIILHIPCDNVVSRDDLKLRELAEKIYKLKKHL
jgi:hypothetical protein